MSNKNDEIEIDLLKLIKALWRRALVIILVALLVASAVFAVTALFISPTYEATASFYVNNSSISIGSMNYSISAGELSASTTLVNTYIYILKSRTTLEDVIEKAALPYTYDELAELIATKAVTGTAAFDVTVHFLIGRDEPLGRQIPGEIHHGFLAVPLVVRDILVSVLDGRIVGRTHGKQ